MKITTDQTITSDLPLNEVLEIEGTLTLDPTKNITITTSKNIIVTGKLISKPNPDVDHFINFVAIDENKYVGGGEQVLDSDVGLWVTGAGQLDIRGQRKTPWLRANGPILDLSTTLNLAVSNWKAGDQLLITPTAKGASNYDVVTIGTIVNSNITLKNRTTEHPLINNTWAAEVANLSRNMRIEGTASGKSHVFIKSSSPQTIQFVGFRYMGPRKDISSDGVKELVTGRYAVHFHHCGNGSRGSIVEGCVCRDNDNHCFVPHGSHGITLRSNVTLNTLETVFWVDFGHKTDDNLIEDNLVAKVGFIPRSQDQDSDFAPTFGAGAFVLGYGDGNICRGNTAVGTTGLAREGFGFGWQELRNNSDSTLQLESSWTFENNTAHNCSCGLLSWQNNLWHHVIRNTILYNNDIGISHGAYGNHYNYLIAYLYNCGIEVFAASATTNRIRFQDVTINAAGADYCVVMNEGPLLDDNPPAGVAPILFLGCKFLNYNKKAILDQNPGAGWKYADVVNCGLSADQYQVSSSAMSGETIRVQEGGKAWKITKSATTSIPLFAPVLWGTGAGLLAEYFTTDFKALLLSRIEANPYLFDITHPSPHYAVPNSFGVRWTGKIQPQYSETYTFYCFAGGGVRLSVNGLVLIDKWAEKYPGNITSKTISMIAGQLYDIKLEFFNNDDRSGCTLEWASPSLKREFIPMSQLYPATITPPPPVNQPPIVDAGLDITIALPTDSVVLNGTGVDKDGTIVLYEWSYISGPSQFLITNRDKPTCTVGNLIQGSYIFRLACTDNKGAIRYDDVLILVKPIPNKLPIANAGADRTMEVFTTLSGYASDGDGSVLSYKWEQVSGVLAIITDFDKPLAKVSFKGFGEHVFRLTVTDDKGATAFDEVKVTVK